MEKNICFLSAVKYSHVVCFIVDFVRKRAEALAKPRRKRRGYIRVGCMPLSTLTQCWIEDKLDQYPEMAKKSPDGCIHEQVFVLFPNTDNRNDARERIQEFLFRAKLSDKGDTASITIMFCQQPFLEFFVVISGTSSAFLAEECAETGLRLCCQFLDNFNDNVKTDLASRPNFSFENDSTRYDTPIKI